MGIVFKNHLHSSIVLPAASRTIPPSRASSGFCAVHPASNARAINNTYSVFIVFVFKFVFDVNLCFVLQGLLSFNDNNF